MGYIDKYRNNVLNSIQEFVSNFKTYFEDALYNSVNSYTGRVGSEVITFVMDSIDAVTKYIYTPYPLKIGDYVNFEQHDWLVVEETEDMFDVYTRAKIKRCNGSITIEVGETVEITGYDSLGRPILNKVKETITLPCIVSNERFSVSNNSSPIMLPENRISVVVAQNNNIKYGNIYEFWGEKYKVIGIDKTYSGIFILLCERVI